MNIHEYQAKEIMRKFGISVPKGVPIFDINEVENKSKIFKFYHFIFVIISMAIILILLTTYKLKINFLEIIKIFFSNFN